ncbi:alpha-E domain-containing protein [Quadrisphaera setariae]|uniref:Alpha-E domain-containing protein n=1 Tax=Quadrisphaera setariae TaxID=2593304 RepID=A0A5C8ZJ46_9ACTN|nr:alpha-E domain-containing protein [Quadrisphaera setariae]TXR57133.1 alpha-E domain-containing protein [Quadrisphaera setariae]
MLSRIAEALFWIGRYVERAEDTARLLDVQLQLLVEDPWLDEGTACANLLAVMGAPLEPGQVGEDGAAAVADRRTVLDRLGYDPFSSASIVASIGGARENARRARETVSTEMWEVLNTAYNAVPSGRWRAVSPHTFFAWVRDRTSTVTGIADSTMSRDDGWLFLVLGRSIERADMTARLITSTASLGGPASRWPSLLRACGAHETFLRTYRGLEDETEAAEFLLLDRLFPRSIVHALAQAEKCLADLESSGQRAGVFDEAQRRLGRARAELEYRPLTDVLAHLPDEMERVQRTCSAASDAVARRYFSSAEALTWVGGTA